MKAPMHKRAYRDKEKLGIPNKTLSWLLPGLSQEPSAHQRVISTRQGCRVAHRNRQEPNLWPQRKGHPIWHLFWQYLFCLSISSVSEEPHPHVTVWHHQESSLEPLLYQGMSTPSNMVFTVKSKARSFWDCAGLTMEEKRKGEDLDDLGRNISG